MNKLYEENTIKSIANAIRAKNGTTTEYHVSDMPTAIANINTNPAPSGSVNITTNGVHEEIAGKAKAIVNVPSDVYEPDTIVANGTYTPTGHAGFSSVTVNINDAPELQNKTVTATEFPVEVVPDDGYYGLNKATVNYTPPRLQATKSVTVPFGTSATVSPDLGYDAIEELTVTATSPSGNQDITSNGTYNITSKAQVTVNVTPEYNLQSKTVTSNGVVTPDEGYNGLSDVTVSVPGPVLVSKSVTANGTYTPASGEDGFNSVTVNVPVPTLTTLSRGIGSWFEFTAPDGTAYNKVYLEVTDFNTQYASETYADYNDESVDANGCVSSVILPYFNDTYQQAIFAETFTLFPGNDYFDVAPNKTILASLRLFVGSGNYTKQLYIKDDTGHKQWLVGSACDSYVTWTTNSTNQECTLTGKNGYKFYVENNSRSRMVKGLYMSLDKS